MDILEPFSNFIATIQAIPNCEFSDSFLIKEPLNAVTNVFYVLAGLRLLREYRQHGVRDLYIKALIFLSFFTGLASAIHHSVPTNFTLFLDGIPIYLILSLMIFLFSQMILNLSPKLSLIIAILYAFFLALASPYVPIDTIPVLKFYLVHTAVFVPLIIVSYLKAGRTAYQLITSLALFWVGMFFFFLDKPICSITPTGSHTLWHLFSSLSFYFLSKFFIQYYRVMLNGLSRKSSLILTQRIKLSAI